MGIVWAALGWKKRKSHTLVHAAGVGINYQKELILHYGEGIDSGKDIYFNGKCRTDFGDIRFFSPDGVELDYFIPPSTLNIGTSASCFVEIKDDLSSIDRDIWIYYENPNAISKSNADATFVSIIPNVALAMPLDEEDREVNPTVIVEANFASFWHSKGSYDAGGTIGDPVVSDATDPFNSVKIDVGVGTNKKWFIQHIYSPATAIFANGSRIALKWNGTNSGNQYAVFFKTASNDKYSFIFTDDFVGEHRVIFVKSSASVTGTPNWNSIAYLTIESKTENVSGTFYAGKYTIEDGVPAQDYGGNGNNGITHGTTVKNSYFTGKKARYFNGVDDIIRVAPNVGMPPDNFTVIAKVNVASNPRSWTGIISTMRWGDKNFCFITDKAPNNNLTANVYFDGGSTERGLVVPFNTWKTIMLGKNNNDVTYYSDTSKQSLTALGDFVKDTALPLCIGGRFATEDFSIIESCSNVTISDVIVFNRQITDEEYLAIHNNYPDSRLITGSIVCRKWANVVDGVYGVEEDYYKSTWLFDSNNNKYITIDGGKSMTLNPHYITELTWLFPE
jgi:hypothetical protein